jgi:ATP-dependent DNA helicase RecG
LDLAEGRFTGIPKIREAMRANGSPEPQFVTDDGRTFFAVELPIHPAFLKPAQAHDVELTDTELRLLRALTGGPKSVPALVRELGCATLSGNLKKALDRLDRLGLIALTLQDKPRSKNQKRRMTAAGRAALDRADRVGNSRENSADRHGAGSNPPATRVAYRRGGWWPISRRLAERATTRRV